MRKSLAWSFAERYSGLVISIASVMVLARILSPGEVGLFSLCAAFVAVAGILRDFGVSEFLIQEKDLTRDKIRGAFAVALIVAWFFGATLFLVRHLVADFYSEPALAQILAVLCINFFILPLASPAFALLNREMAFDKVFAIQLSSNLAQAATGITMALAGHSYMSLAWASVANVAVQALAVTAIRPRDSFITPSWREARPALTYGMMFCSTRVIESVTRNFHEFVIGRQFGFAALGIFSRAVGLFEMFYTSVTSAVLRVLTPAFAEERRAGRSLKEAYRHAVAIFTSIAWPVFAFLAISAADIIYFMFGPQWEEAAPLASILCGGALIYASTALAPNLLSSTGHVDRRLRVSLQASVVQLAGVSLGALVSLKGVAVAWIVTWIVTFLLFARHLATALDFSASDFLKATGKSAVVTIGVVGAQTLMLFAATYLALPRIVAFLSVCLIAALAWFALVVVLRHPASEEIFKLFKRTAPPPGASN